MGKVTSIIPAPAALDAAWERYRALAQAAIENPRFLLNRDRLAEMTRAYADFRRLFLASDQRKDA